MLRSFLEMTKLDDNIHYGYNGGHWGAIMDRRDDNYDDQDIMMMLMMISILMIMIVVITIE